MIVIGLTGGIASGKSLVAGELAKLPGFAAIDIDRVAWECYGAGSPAYRKLVEHFGSGIVGPGGEIDRRRLGEIVFNNRSELQFLDEAVHPAITARLRELVEEQRRRGTKALILEAALLLESRRVDRTLFDYIVALKVDQKEQLRRLRERDGLSREEAELRIKSQDRAKLEGADYIIETSGTPGETVAKIRELVASLLRKAVE